MPGGLPLEKTIIRAGSTGWFGGENILTTIPENPAGWLAHCYCWNLKTIRLIYEVLSRNNLDSIVGPFSEILITSNGTYYNKTHNAEMTEFARLVEDRLNQSMGIPNTHALYEVFPIHSIRWDAGNYTSGTFLVIMTASNFTQSKSSC